MPDENRGKYNMIYKREYEMAESILKQHLGGWWFLEWSWHDFEAFRLTTPDRRVMLVFYPHKTTAGNVHLRVRDQNSKDPDLAREILIYLNELSGYNSTFYCKNLPRKRGK